MVLNEPFLVMISLKDRMRRLEQNCSFFASKADSWGCTCIALLSSPGDPKAFHTTFSFSPIHAHIHSGKLLDSSHRAEAAMPPAGGQRTGEVSWITQWFKRKQTSYQIDCGTNSYHRLHNRPITCQRDSGTLLASKLFPEKLESVSGDRDIWLSLCC